MGILKRNNLPLVFIEKSPINDGLLNYSPEIFNTDKGSQFTSDAFIDVLKSNGIQISMDGKLAQYTAHRLIM